MRRALTVWVCGLVLLGPWIGCKKSTPNKKSQTAIEHRGGIPIIPRGKVTVAAPKGERFLLEIEARMPLTQAVSFYRRRLAREGWSELQVQKVQVGLWGLAATRGMFELTGRIKQLSQGTISIGFERRVRKRADAVTPPVPSDVPILKGQVTWRGPFFEASGGRAEIRGTSKIAATRLRKTLAAALQLQGWTVKRAQGDAPVEAIKRLTKTLTGETRKVEARRLQQRGWIVKLLQDGKTLDAERRLTYHVEAIGTASRLRLILAYDELTPNRPASDPRARPAAAVDAGVPRPRPPHSANVVPLPKDLTLWPTAEPVLGVRRSKSVLSFTLDRKCKTPAALLKKILPVLARRGYHALNARRAPPAALVGGRSAAATLMRGKQAVVVVVSRELDDCTVQLTVLSKPR